MKKIGVLLIILFTFNFTYLNAITDEECINHMNEANFIDAYTEDNIADDLSVLIQVKVEGLTENTFVTIVNDYDNVVKEYYYSDTENGVLTLNSPYIYKRVRYIINVYTVDRECNSEPINTFYLKTDMYNMYSRYDICEESDIDMCSMFYDISDMTEKEFMQIAQEKIGYANRSIFQKVIDFIKDYYLFIITPIVLVSTYFIVRITVLKRGRDEKYNKKD